MTWLGLPTKSSQWSALFALWAGGLVGYLISPRIWVTLTGPFRWLAMLSGTAAQESYYDPEASGDAGASRGIVQFGTAAWNSAMPGASDRRLSAFWSGYASAKYVSFCLSQSMAWSFKFAVPYLGFAAMRMMWTGGSSASIAARPFFSTERVSSGAAVGMYTRAIEEGKRTQSPTLGYTAWSAWRLASLPAVFWSYRQVRKWG